MVGLEDQYSDIQVFHLLLLGGATESLDSIISGHREAHRKDNDCELGLRGCGRMTDWFDSFLVTRLVDEIWCIRQVDRGINYHFNT